MVRLRMCKCKGKKETPANSFLGPPSVCEYETLCRKYKPEHSCHAVHVISKAARPTSWITMHLWYTRRAGSCGRSYTTPPSQPSSVTKSKGTSSLVGQGDSPIWIYVPLPAVSRRGVPPQPTQKQQTASRGTIVPIVLEKKNKVEGLIEEGARWR